MNKNLLCNNGYKVIYTYTKFTLIMLVESHLNLSLQLALSKGLAMGTHYVVMFKLFNIVAQKDLVSFHRETKIDTFLFSSKPDRLRRHRKLYCLREN